MEQMIKVQIEGKEYEYPAGTTYRRSRGIFKKSTKMIFYWSSLTIDCGNLERV